MATVLITGASGNVGAATAAALRDAGSPVRMASRSGSGPDGVPFDFTDASTWGDAFDGVESMLLVRPPAIGNVKRDLLPALLAARERGVEHVVFLSLQGAERNRVVPHATVEAWLRASGMDWTFLRASFFHQNLTTTHVADIRDRDEIVVPAGGGATAFVDARDVGACAAVALGDRAHHAGKAWTITGPRAITYAQIASMLTDELDRPISYTRPGALRYAWHAKRALGMSLGMTAVTTAIYTTARMGLAASLSDDARLILGRDPIDFSEFAHDARGSWMPAGKP